MSYPMYQPSPPPPPKKPRVMESTGFLIAMIAVAAVIVLVWLVSAMAGQDSPSDSNAGLVDYSYDLSYQAGSPGGGASAKTMGADWNTACQNTFREEFVFADDPILHPGPVLTSQTDYVQGCFDALNDYR